MALAARVFAEHGYHGASIEAIARTLGGSRAAVYQYFEGKDAIFAELVEESAPALLAHAGRLNGLGPHESGFEALRRWIVELGDLYDGHAAALVQCGAIGIRQGPVPLRARELSDDYIATVMAAVADASPTCGLSVTDTVCALLCVSHTVNLYRSRGMFGLDSADVTSASLSVALQRLIFPDTPPSVLCSGRSVPDGADHTQSIPPPIVDSVIPPPPVSPIGQDILAHASVLFACKGFHAVSMEEIAGAAEVSRATLYRLYHTKAAILVELSDWGVIEGRGRADELYCLGRAGVSLPELHRTLAHYVRFHRTYSGVIRSWYDGSAVAQLPADTLTAGLSLFSTAAASVLADVGIPEGIDQKVATAIFMAVLARLSESAVTLHPEATDYQTAELIMTVLRYTVFAADPPVSKPVRR